MAYVLWHYTSLQLEPNQEANEAEWTSYEGKLDHCIWEGTASVAACAQPCKSYRGRPIRTVKLVIHITNHVCPDCSNFRERILLYTGFDVSLEKM